MIIGAVGLCLNIISVLVVHDHGGHGHGHDAPASSSAPVDPLADLHLREGVHAQHHHTLFPPTSTLQPNLGLVAVLIHLLGDAVNSVYSSIVSELSLTRNTLIDVGVIVAGILIWKLHSPNRFYADPAVSLGISLIIFASAIPMSACPVRLSTLHRTETVAAAIKAGRILLEAAPVELDLDKVREDLLTLPDVVSIHDMHVWILSQSYVFFPARSPIIIYAHAQRHPRLLARLRPARYNPRAVGNHGAVIATLFLRVRRQPRHHLARAVS